MIGSGQGFGIGEKNSSTLELSLFLNHFETKRRNNCKKHSAFRTLTDATTYILVTFLQFNWHAVPERERERHSHTAEAVHSPTMAGGLFSIDKKFFERLGTYDSGFDIWGGENLELSFKVKTKRFLGGGALVLVVVGSNPGTVYWMDINHIILSKKLFEKDQK